MRVAAHHRRELPQVSPANPELPDRLEQPALRRAAHVRLERGVLRGWRCRSRRSLSRAARRHRHHARSDHRACARRGSQQASLQPREGRLEQECGRALPARTRTRQSTHHPRRLKGLMSSTTPLMLGLAGGLALWHFAPRPTLRNASGRRDADSETYSAFTLVTYPEGIGGARTTRWFRPDAPMPWQAARAQLVAAKLIDPDAISPNQAGSWRLVTDSRVFT